jgi:hypothetical protein
VAASLQVRLEPSLQQIAGTIEQSCPKLREQTPLAAGHFVLLRIVTLCD